ncbi:MAG: hypothetical protein ACI4U9_03765 [Clostridia bacterium]
MDDVSIILSTRQCIGSNDVEVVGECEKEYNALSLYSFSIDIIQKAKACGGKMIPWTKEPQLQKFCYAFRFETEEGKKEFLHKLFSSC